MSSFSAYPYEINMLDCDPLYVVMEDGWTLRPSYTRGADPERSQQIQYQYFHDPKVLQAWVEKHVDKKFKIYKLSPVPVTVEVKVALD